MSEQDPRPRVVYDPFTNWDEQPFAISVDEVAAAGFFRSSGMTDEQITRKTIMISAEISPLATRSGEFTGGTYNPSSEIFDIHIMDFYAMYQSSLSYIIEFAALQIATQRMESFKEASRNYEKVVRNLLVGPEVDEVMDLASTSPRDFLEKVKDNLVGQVNKSLNLTFMSLVPDAVARDNPSMEHPALSLGDLIESPDFQPPINFTGGDLHVSIEFGLNDVDSDPESPITYPPSAN